MKPRGHWTKTPPSKPGWYCMRLDVGGEMHTEVFKLSVWYFDHDHSELKGLLVSQMIGMEHPKAWPWLNPVYEFWSEPIEVPS